jgi:hypothetical protein
MKRQFSQIALNATVGLMKHTLMSKLVSNLHFCPMTKRAAAANFEWKPDILIDVM